jgi:hypothetical protein
MDRDALRLARHPVARARQVGQWDGGGEGNETTQGKLAVHRVADPRHYA